MGDQEQEQTSTAADPGGQAGSTDERLTAVENAVDRIGQLVERLVPGGHAGAQERTERHLDRGSSVAEQVRAELARAREQDAAAASAAAAADSEQSERRAVQERLARLEERPPAPPRSRRTALLGWGDGRSA